MAVVICTPYRTDKNLGKAYNEAFDRIGDDDWNCFHDIDTTFLTSDAGAILDEYAKRFPNAGILTCLTNRIGALSRPQLYNGIISDNSDIRYHIEVAEKLKKNLYTTTTINQDISGMLMMISKRTWQQIKFAEDGKCLLVDTYYNRRIRNAGKKILLMNGLYIFHIYRMKNGIKDKSHLL